MMKFILEKSQLFHHIWIRSTT